MSSVGSDNVVPLKRPGAQPTARGGTNRALKTSLMAATTPTGRAAGEATILSFPPVFDGDLPQNGADGDGKEDTFAAATEMFTDFAAPGRSREGRLRVDHRCRGRRAGGAGHEHCRAQHA